MKMKIIGMSNVAFRIFSFCVIVNVALGLPSGVYCQGGARAGVASRPNILFIVSEDNGPELGCYGAPVKTPNLDRLALDGLLFQRAFVAQAGCSQSRGAFLTGLYPHQNGQIGLATSHYAMYKPETPNVPRSLKAAGYRTGIIGKVHVNPESAFPFDHMSSIQGGNFQRKRMSQYATEAGEFFKSGEGPFYLQVNYPDAHAPFLRQVDGLPEKPFTADDVKPLPYMMVDSRSLRELTADYYNCLMRLDTYIGDLLQELRKSGKYDNTLIIYIGDHGADLLRGKRTSYEGGLRIPMIVSWPGKGPAGVSRREMVSTLDLYPTFLEIAGLPVPKYLPGRSLVPLIMGQKTDWRKYLFSEWHTHSNGNPYPQRAVRDERYKLIFNPISGVENPGFSFTLEHNVVMSEEELYRGAPSDVRKSYQRMKTPPEFELYDLEKDPYEMVNLADDSKHAKILERLRQSLFSWQKETGDPLVDRKKAKALFDMILETGEEGKKAKRMVPYHEMMDPGMVFGN